MGKFEYSKEDLLYYKKLVELSEEEIQNLQPIDMSNISRIDDIKIYKSFDNKIFNNIEEANEYNKLLLLKYIKEKLKEMNSDEPSLKKRLDYSNLFLFML